MSDFTTIAPNYQQTAVLQKSASERLFDMLDIGRKLDVLDLGCGPGNLTQKIRSATDGLVVGIDPSAGMIAGAQRDATPDITFYVGDAESLHMVGQFDAIFCNSAFQWFRDPRRAVVNCFNALRPGGRIAIQAPARTNYCPNFLLATDSLKGDPRTQEPFTHFLSPWFFLETAEDYADIFAAAGFSVLSSNIETVVQRCTPEKALEMFESGAAAGYLNPDCYDAALPSTYTSTARELIAHHFHLQASSDGQVELRFFRIYLLARKA
jgi:trans-aconitate 2-methyltransferase